METSAKKLPHVVVLGAGFAGLTFAKEFPAGIARLTVVDRANHHLFTPLLYQVATAGLAAPDIAQPIRSILQNRSDVTVLMDEVVGIDVGAREVKLRAGTLRYDYLVFALGSRVAYYDHPEWEEHAPGLKTIEDAIRLRRDILQAFERAEHTDNPVERRRLMTTVVIGGGPTGVELAGACAELQRHVLLREFRRLNLAMARVVLIESGPRVLATYPPALSEKAKQQLEELGVTVWLGARVKEIRPGEVITQNEALRAATIIWAAGVKASPLTAHLGVESDQAGRVKVLPDLSAPGHPEVFVIGDAAAVTNGAGEIVPGFCPSAMQMGRHAARLIANEIRSGATPPAEPRSAFVYCGRGMMATIGRSRAIAKVRGLEFSGFPAWLVWLGVHLVFLIGLRNRISVFLQWVYSYFTYRRGARVIYDLPLNARAAVH
jgi:NADH:ubiquinone reductase (H+-translocating)